MATLTVESEWMTHYVGSPLPKVSKLWCLDTAVGPLIFYIEDQTGKLFVHRATDDHHGQSSIDLSDLWGIKGSVISVAVAQNKKGLVYAAFVERRSTAAESDSVFLMRAMDPGSLVNKESWRNAVIRPSNNLGSSNLISTVNLGPAPDTVSFPEVVLHYKSSDGSHVAQVEVNSAQTSFRVVMYALPITPDASTDLFAAPAVLDTSSGIFFCYISGGQRVLTFVSSQTYFGMQVPPSIGVVSGVNSMQTMVNHDGFTDLLIGSDDGLDWYKSEDCIYSDAPRKRLVNGKITHVRGASPSITGARKIWMIRNSMECGYVELDASGNPSDFVTVTSGHYHSVLSPTVSSTGSLSRIVYYDDKGDLLMLEQSGVGIWGTKPLTLPAPDKIIESSAHVTRIHITAEDISQVLSAKFKLTCTSSATIIVNGKTRVVDSTAGIEVVPNASGLIELINPSEGLETPHFFIKDAPDTGVPLVTSEHPIDVSLAVRQRIAEKSNMTPEQLQNSKNKEGAPLFDASTDFSHLATTLQAINGRIKKLKSDGTATAVDTHPTHPEKHWSLFHWADQQASSAKHFFMDAEHLLVTIGEKVWAFAVSCYEEALKAAHSVLIAAGAAWHDLLHWVGWIFNWEDIVQTQQSLQSLFNGLAACTDAGIDALFVHIDEQLSAARNYFAKPDAYPTGDSTKEKNSQKSLDDHQKSSAASKDKPAPASHPAIDYIMGKLESFYIPTNDDLDFDLQHNSINTFWATGFQEVMSKITADLKIIKNDIAAIFSKGNKLSIAECLAKIGKDSMILLIDCIRELLDVGVKPACQFIFKALATAITTPLKVPFISALYKHATGSTADPSIIDIMTLLMAVPITILGKLCYGKDFKYPALDSNTVIQALKPPQAPPAGGNVRRNEKTSFYWTLEQAILGPLSNYQALTCSVVDFWLMGFSAIEDDRDIVLPAGWPSPTKAKAMLCALKFASTVLAIPIIDPAYYDTTVLPEVRFTAYGVDLAFFAVDVVSFCLGAQQVNIEAGFVRTCTRFVLQQVFTVPEIATHYPQFDQTTNDRKRDLAIMRCVELIFWLASDTSLCIAAEARESRDPEDMEIALIAGALSGYVAMGSQIARGAWAGKDDVACT